MILAGRGKLWNFKLEVVGLMAYHWKCFFKTMTLKKKKQFWPELIIEGLCYILTEGWGSYKGNIKISKLDLVIYCRKSLFKTIILGKKKNFLGLGYL